MHIPLFDVDRQRGTERETEREGGEKERERQGRERECERERECVCQGHLKGSYILCDQSLNSPIRQWSF